jgi:hypothetical protein
VSVVWWIFWRDDVLTEKPSISVPRGFRGREPGVTAREYLEGALFVGASYIEYGRQAYIHLLRNSGDATLEEGFRPVTGDPLQEVHRK